MVAQPCQGRKIKRGMGFFPGEGRKRFYRFGKGRVELPLGGGVGATGDSPIRNKMNKGEGGELHGGLSYGGVTTELREGKKNAFLSKETSLLSAGRMGPSSRKSSGKGTLLEPQGGSFLERR